MPDAGKLSRMVDRFHDAREQRLEADRRAAALKKEENDLKQLIIDNLLSSGTDVIGGRVLTVTLVKKSKPSAQDWGAIYDYIKEHDAFDLLHRRLTEKAVKERWDAEENVPGVVELTVNDLSLSTQRVR